MFQYITATSGIDFNRLAVQSLNISVSQQRKTLFSSFPLTGFLHLFLHLFPPCVTLVTAKKLNRCWYARDTHAWDSFPSHRLFSLLFFADNTQKSSQSRILASRDSISNTRKENHSLFCDFFPLWGNISPYTYRGARWRCTPFSFFFHGESHSHIYADTSDNSASTIYPQSTRTTFPTTDRTIRLFWARKLHFHQHTITMWD